VPEDYGDTFKVMVEIVAFTEEFLKNLFEMTKFRNRLINLCCTIDKKELYKILQDNLSDFNKLLQYLESLSAKRLNNCLKIKKQLEEKKNLLTRLL